MRLIGGGTDPYNNYSQRGSFQSLEHTVTALVETFPIISRLRLLRMWGGIVDMTGDRSPIIGPGMDERRLREIGEAGVTTAVSVSGNNPGIKIGVRDMKPRTTPNDYMAKIQKENWTDYDAVVCVLYDDSWIITAKCHEQLCSPALERMEFAYCDLRRCDLQSVY